MTDLEMTKLAAEAMGCKILPDYSVGRDFIMVSGREFTGLWQPLHDDAQAMALVKRHDLCIQPPGVNGGIAWHVWRYQKPNCTGVSIGLNRAIVECVANLQEGKHGKANRSSDVHPENETGRP
jgi:hypothetical protein